MPKREQVELRPVEVRPVDHWLCDVCPPSDPPERLIEVRHGARTILVCLRGLHTVSKGLAKPVFEDEALPA